MDFYAWAIDEPSHEREIILRLGAAAMFVVCAIVLYCVVPMSGDLWWVATLAGPVAGVLLTPLALTSTQRILASDPKWTPEAIDLAILVGKTVRIPLKAPIAVYAAYWTAFVDDDGVVEFRSDIYGWDKAVLDRLADRG